MPESGYLAVFLIGLLGGVHCLSMCGGIVGALSVNMPLHGPGDARRGLFIQLAYNLGRLTTYGALGMGLGAIGSLGMLLDSFLPIQLGLYVLANVMLILLGLYLTGYTAPLLPVERFGQQLWRHVQPLTRRFLPARSPLQAYPLGLLWGFIPCGLVYSVLATALVTGSPWRGGGLMLAFGLGTLPNLMLAGWALKRMRDVTRQTWLRRAAGMLVLGFGTWGLIYAPVLGGKLWEGVVCHT